MQLVIGILFFFFFFLIFADGIDAIDLKERVNKVDKEKPVLPRITKELDGYVGFANFPNQVYRKAIKKGFEFTLMVVGKFFTNLYLLFFFTFRRYFVYLILKVTLCRETSNRIFK